MKKVAFILMALVLTVGTQACSYSGNYGFGSGKRVIGSNNYVTKEIRIDNFKHISVSGSADVTYTQKSGRPKVEVYTSDNIVELLNIYVEDNTLRIGFKKGYNISYKKLEVRVTSPTLNGISIAGSADIDLVNGVKTDDFKLNIAGSADINSPHTIDCTNSCDISIAGSGDIDANTLRCNQLNVTVAGSGDMTIKDAQVTNAKASVAGSGTVTIAGTVDTAEYSVAGSGDLNVSNFRARSVSARVTGSGDIRCHATEFLKARTAGSGSIGYKGDPQLDLEKKGVYKL